LKVLSILLMTLFGLLMCAGVAYFSTIVISISDGNFADRLTNIIAGLDANSQGGVIVALKLCRALFIFGALLPVAEIISCALAIVALVVFFVRGDNKASARLYGSAFALPIIVVAPLLIASPLSAYLTRANKISDVGLGDATGWALFGVVFLLLWIIISGVSFLGASAAMKR
jgi:hypothetical protein